MGLWPSQAHAHIYTCVHEHSTLTYKIISGKDFNGYVTFEIFRVNTSITLNVPVHVMLICVLEMYKMYAKTTVTWIFIDRSVI